MQNILTVRRPAKALAWYESWFDSQLYHTLYAIAMPARRRLSSIESWTG
jgi:hypothetical protein